KGWSFVQTGPDEWEWLKFASNGKSIARGGDNTWNVDVNSINREINTRS
ncbi:hypothetical protein LCGC14_1826420, partial [marine sediment metagenome]